MTWISSLRRLTVLGLLVAGTLSVPAQNANATTFAEMSVEQFTDASTYIVKGVVEGTPRTALEEKAVYTYATVRITEVLKGPDTPATVEVRQMGGTFGGATTAMPGQAVFSDGESVFLFLHLTSSGDLVPVSKFMGKYTMRRAPGERRTYVRQWQKSRATKTYDHRFLPHPDLTSRVYLDELEGQVRGRLVTGWDGQPVVGMTLENLERVNLPERRLR